MTPSISSGYTINIAITSSPPIFMMVQDQIGLFRPLFFCFVALATCFVVDGWRTLPLLVIWTAGSGLRWYSGDRQVATDCFVFGALNTYLVRDALKIIVLRKLEELDESVVRWSWFLLSRVAFPLVFIGLLSQWQKYRKDNTAKALPEGITKWTTQYPSARIFPCQTKHARMFPKRHAFEYSYLQVGFPVIPSGVMTDGTEIGLGEDRLLGCWWMRIRAEDYLERGNGALGFYGKLKKYLQSQNVNDADWSYAYLVTAPRFMGYAFNPVSFWYIYDAEHQLNRMILEVNNTFGERRMYLLDGSNVPSTPSTTDSEVMGLELPLGAKSRFTDIWMKDFHVSPFNSRKGSYVLKASNPFPYASYDNPIIDNTITLISTKDYAKLVARLNSTGAALKSDELGVIGTMRFVVAWWWVGLATFPRIIKEAFKLFFKRGLHVWFRPEVLHTGIGRTRTMTEVELYKIFKDYLIHLVHQSQLPFNVTLHTSIPEDPIQKITATHQLGWDHVPKELEIRVLTPSFYSRFVHYAYTSEAFDRECIFTDEKNRTLWISRPELLPMLLNELSHVELEQKNPVQRSYFDELRWMLLKKLRCAPHLPAYAVPSPRKAAITTEDVRSLPYSELDQYVRSFRGRTWAGEYRRTTTKLFLAQRFGLGFAEVIGLLDLIIRVLFCCLAMFQVMAWRAQSPAADTGGCSMRMLVEGSFSRCYENVREVHGEWWWLIGATVSVSACHMYGMLKGYN